MRKDLKIGMAIGAVLLVVLIVYFAMPKPEGTDVVAVDAGGGDEPALTADPDPNATIPEPAAPEGEPAAEEDGPAAEEDEPATEPSAPHAPPVIAEAPEPSVPMGRDAKGAAPEREEVVAEGDDGDTNWAMLLVNGGNVPPHRTETPPAAARGAAGADEAVPAPDTARPPLRTGRAPTGEAAATRDRAAAREGAAGGDFEARPSPPAVRRFTADADAPGTDSATTPVLRGNAAATPRTRAPEDARGAARTWTVKAQENYSSIARAHYGESRYYLEIEKANPHLDATRLRPGTVIDLPNLATIDRGPSGGGDADAASQPKPIDPETEYEVKAGDSLHKIAARRYGTPVMADQIYELNEQSIGPDPAKLKLGIILKMPPKPRRDTGSGESASR